VTSAAKRTILIAEDDTDDQALFIDFVGHRNDLTLLPFAENGEVLINLLDQLNGNGAFLPDFIILDQNMPKRSGLQTLKYLKGHPRYTKIPVMLYSTYIDKDLIEKGTELGACKVVPKPLTTLGYNALIEELLHDCT
jgi:CheY-like chemotaxis protein